MARYIDADALKTAILTKYRANWEIPCSSEDRLIQRVVTDLRVLIEQSITADVAPKSEVERLIGKFECFLCHATGGRLSKYTYDLGTMESVATDCINETYNDGYGEGYKDCAREIFEEIELFLKKAIDGWRKERKFAYNDRQIEMIDFRNGAFKYCLHEIAKLKKKYTEERE